MDSSLAGDESTGCYRPVVRRAPASGFGLRAQGKGLRALAPQAVEVGGVVEGRSMVLSVPDRLGEAVHDVVPRVVHRAVLARERFDGGTDAWRLVDRELLLDGEVHLQMEEGVGLAALRTP